MQYTAGQAAQATGKNIATITRAVKSGRISAQKDERGAWRIDASELHRVFPLRAETLRNNQTPTDARDSQEPAKDQVADMQAELAVLRERVAAQSNLLSERAGQISDLKEERDRWRQQATNLLLELKPTTLHSSGKKRRWWPF